MDSFDHRIYYEQQHRLPHFPFMGDYSLLNTSDPFIKAQLFDNLVVENRRLKLVIQNLQNLLEQKFQKTCSKNCCQCNAPKEPFSLFVKKEMVKVEPTTKEVNFRPSDVKIEIDSKPFEESTSMKHLETTASQNSTPEEEDDAYSPYSASLEHKDDDCSQNLSNGIRKKKYWKSAKESQKNKEVKARPDTKHLWISYGRAIHTYGLENTKGEIKEKIEALKGKLTSKTEYSEVFLVRDEDTPEEINFRRTFGKVALKFLNEEIQKAFLNSKFRHELLSQKSRVADWITYLMESEPEK